MSLLQTEKWWCKSTLGVSATCFGTSDVLSDMSSPIIVWHLNPERGLHLTHEGTSAWIALSDWRVYGEQECTCCQTEGACPLQAYLTACLRAYTCTSTLGLCMIHHGVLRSIKVYRQLTASAVAQGMAAHVCHVCVHSVGQEHVWPARDRYECETVQRAQMLGAP